MLTAESCKSKTLSGKHPQVLLQRPLCSIDKRLKSNLMKHLVQDQSCSTGLSNTQELHNCFACDFAADERCKMESHIKSRHDMASNRNILESIDAYCKNEPDHKSSLAINACHPKVLKKETPCNIKYVCK